MSLHVFTCFYMYLQVFTCIYMMYLLLTLAIKNICPKSLKWCWMQYKGVFLCGKFLYCKKKQCKKMPPNVLQIFSLKSLKSMVFFFMCSPWWPPSPGAVSTRHAPSTCPTLWSTLQRCWRQLWRRCPKVSSRWGYHGVPFSKGWPCLVSTCHYLIWFIMIQHDLSIYLIWSLSMGE